MATLSPIKPSEIHTADVEALTSHIAALAMEHRVTIPTILSHLVPTRTCSEMYTINGHLTYARRLIESIQVNGGFSQLEGSTCLPWSNWLNPTGQTLLKRNRCWCGQCLANDLSDGKRPYQRLYWCLGSVEVCVKHRCYLQQACSKCGALQLHLPRLPFLERCGTCGAFLVGDESRDEHPSSDLIWDAEATYELIGATHKAGMNGATQERMRELIEDLVNKLADGKAYVLSKLTGIELACIKRWRSGATRPSLVQFIRFCRSVQCPPSALITGHPLFIDTALIKKIDEAPLRVVTHRSKDDFADLERRLAQLLQSTVGRPLSLKEVARRLGRSESVLIYRYPGKAKEIIRAAGDFERSQAGLRSEQRKERLLAALGRLQSQEIYPSDRHLKKIGGVPASDLRRPELKHLIAEAKRTSRFPVPRGGVPRRKPVGPV